MNPSLAKYSKKGLGAFKKIPANGWVVGGILVAGWFGYREYKKYKRNKQIEENIKYFQNDPNKQKYLSLATRLYKAGINGKWWRYWTENEEAVLQVARETDNYRLLEKAYKALYPEEENLQTLLAKGLDNDKQLKQFNSFANFNVLKK